MKNRILLALVTLTVALSSCKKDDVMLFNGATTLNFIKSYYLGSSVDASAANLDTIKINTAYYSGSGIIDVKLPIRMSGKVVGVDRPFKVGFKASEATGTIVEHTHYTMERSQIFNAGRVDDSVVIKVNIAQLKADRVEGRIVVQLLADNLFTQGIEKYNSIGVYLSGKGFPDFAPDFYGYNKLTDYIGGLGYNKFVLEKFAEYAGITNDQWRESNHFKRYSYAKETYFWFKANPTHKETGAITTADDPNRIVVKGEYSFE